jgi:predicted transcriptional regulator
MSDSISHAPARDRARRLISLIPGIHLRELHRLLGISFNATRYNVEKLSGQGEIVVQREKGFTRLYPPGITESEKRAYPFLRRNSSKSILAALLRERAGLTHKELTEKTKLSKSTVSENLQRLLEEGIIRVSVSDGLKTLYDLPEDHNLSFMIVNSRVSTGDSATKRYIDLWDF